MSCLLKLCDATEESFCYSPLIKAPKAEEDPYRNISYRPLAIEGWQLYEKRGSETLLRKDKGLFSMQEASNGISIPAGIYTHGAGDVSAAGLIKAIAVKPNTCYSIALRLKCNNPLTKICAVIEEYEYLDVAANYFSDKDNGLIASRRYNLDKGGFESPYLPLGDVDFVTEMRTRFAILRIELTPQSRAPQEENEVQLEYFRLSELIMSKQDELAMVYSRYFDPDKRLTPDKYGIRKKMMLLDKEHKNTEYRTVLFAAAPTVIKYDLCFPKKARLEFGYSLLRESWARCTTPIQFEVSLRENNAEQEKCLFRGTIDPQDVELSSKWREASIDLSYYQGKKASILFKTSQLFSGQTSQADKDSPYGYAVWSNPVIYADTPDSLNPNVIFISLDGVIMSHLGCYGYRQRQTSPVIDKIAQEGIKFSRCITVSNWTQPSHIAMLTSYYPWIFKKQEKVYTIDAQATTIAEVLSNVGYRTAAFTGDAWLGEMSLTRGFEEYHSRWADKSVEMEANFHVITDFIEKNRNNKFFIFWHSFETHHPFLRQIFTEGQESPEGVRFDPGRVETMKEYLKSISRKEIEPNGQEVRFMAALLDGAIKYADNLIGLLMERLEELGILDNTILVLTADHGNQLLNERMHSVLLSDEIIKVPLVIKGRGLPQGKIIDTQVTTLDIVPTILDFLGLRVPEEMQGRSLKSLAAEGTGYLPSFVFSLSDMGPPEKICARKNDCKLIYIPGRNINKFYDLRNDPSESYDIDYLSCADYPAFKHEILQFIVSSLPGKNFYLSFFGEQADFMGRITSEGVFGDFAHLYFGEESDIYSFNPERKELEFKVKLVEGFKMLRFSTLANDGRVLLNILLDGKILRNESISLKQIISRPMTRGVLKLELEGIDNLSRGRGCIFCYLED